MLRALAERLGVLFAAAVLGALLLLALFEPQRALHAALPEPLRPFRPLPMRLLNALNLATSTVFGTELVALDAAALLAQSCDVFNAETGATAGAPCDWGDAEWGSSWREGYAVLIDSLRDEAELTLIGRIFATHRLEMVLAQRLRLVAYWKRGTPSGDAVRADSTKLAPPLFVVGLPRTGTSFLHSLLSRDTANFRSPLNWMVVDPVPPLFGRVGDGASPVEGEDPAVAALRAERIATAQSNLAQFKAIAPGVDAQHAMTAFRPEECIVMFAHSFSAGFEFITYFNVPSFGDWLASRRDFTDAFKWHRQMLRHLGSTVAVPKSKPKAWVLKTPFYTAMLADLVAEHPEARIVMTHRRPIRSMASLNSLQMKLRSVASDKASPRGIANETFAQWDVFAGRAVGVREEWAAGEAVCGGRGGALGGRSGAASSDASAQACSAEKRGSRSPGGGIADVELSELHTSPMRAVRRIYAELDLTLSAEAVKKMETWLAVNSREKHGKNNYSPEWFGPEFKYLDGDAGREALEKRPGLQRYDDFFCGMYPRSCA